MRVLGAVLAGGHARRFGADKALATLDGVPLILHTIAALASQVEQVVVCGREMAGIVALLDRPAGGMGPLAGLAAALHRGRQQGYDAVLSVPCDVPLLPMDLLAFLGGGGEAAFVADLPVIGCWPCRFADDADAQIASGDRSMRRWAARIGAVACRLPVPLANINTPEDLARLAAAHG